MCLLGFMLDERASHLHSCTVQAFHFHRKHMLTPPPRFLCAFFLAPCLAMQFSYTFVAQTKIPAFCSVAHAPPSHQFPGFNRC